MGNGLCRALRTRVRHSPPPSPPGAGASGAAPAPSVQTAPPGGPFTTQGASGLHKQGTSRSPSQQEPSRSNAPQQEKYSGPREPSFQLRTPRMAPTESDRKAADKLKGEGNALFQKGKFAAAVDVYTEAITHCPDWAVLYVNRAMAHKKRGDWRAVAHDAQRALSLERDLMKAHYLLGLAYGQQHHHNLAQQHLTKALEAAREQNDAIKDEIWHELAAANYSHFEEQAAARKAQHAQLRQQLADLLRQQRPQGQEEEQQAAPAGGNGAAASPPALPSEWEALFSAAVARDTPGEAPSLLTCPLTLEIYRDPVVAPSGRSYERTALLDHLKKVGKFDPITRQPMSERDVVPNFSMRAAVEHFLQEHPWAWREVK